MHKDIFTLGGVVLIVRVADDARAVAVPYQQVILSRLISLQCGMEVRRKPLDTLHVHTGETRAEHLKTSILVAGSEDEVRTMLPNQCPSSG